jgi:mannitol-1-phosphate/altronate dehydrogenase
LMCDVMLSQDCLYTLVERSLEGDQARIIGSIDNPNGELRDELSLIQSCPEVFL